MAELAVEVGGLDDRDDELVVETITGHAAALLRTARRYSLCADDAHDAYQRAVEIFLTRAARLRRDTVVNWLHQVVKKRGSGRARGAPPARRQRGGRARRAHRL